MSTPAIINLSRSDIQRQQWSLLCSLIDTIRLGNQFYSNKFSTLPDLDSIHSMDSDEGIQWFQSTVPFTRKTELTADQQAHPPYGSNLSFDLNQYSRYNQTSGTGGGMPIRWLDTRESWSWMVDNWVQVMLLSGVTKQDRVFFAFSFGPFLGFWTAFEAAARIGCISIPGGGMSSAGRLRSIMDNEATVVCCTPTYALHLGEAARAEGICLETSSVHTLIVAGEPGAGIPATRSRIEALWGGACVKDHHGMTEVGPVSYECPADPTILHILETAYIAEVLTEDGNRIAEPGEQGELILTNLGRTGSPLLRYRTGDLVQTDGRLPEVPCHCGRFDLGLRGGILGRTDDMVVVRGVNLHPSAVEAVISAFPEIAEHQVCVYRSQAMVDVHLQIEPFAGVEDATLVHRVESALRTAFNLRIPVEQVSVGSLPRFEMKARRWKTF